jgi:diguanylate cyclase (GGDEF)-like protein
MRPGRSVSNRLKFHIARLPAMPEGGRLFAFYEILQTDCENCAGRKAMAAIAGAGRCAVPIFAEPNFMINLPTLCAVTGFITAISGLLLLFAWAQSRREPALALWGLAYLIATAGAAFLVRGGLMAPAWSICIGNALICCAYGTMWAGARSFEGRPVALPLVTAGAAIWIIACALTSLAQDNAARVAVTSVILATYSLLCAYEMWFARDRELISRWPTLALAAVHAGFLLARIPFAGEIRYLYAVPHPAYSGGLFVLAFEALFVTFCQAFLRVSMAKERAELQQRQAAMTDSLTGAANRRAFFELGAPLLERTIADRRPAALLLFDLDRFKEVNDTAGHQAGDGVLQAFAHLVANSIRPGDLFARLGGEEFACLLAGASMAEALKLAERLRARFAAMPFADLTSGVTVSIGVAMANETGRNLSALLAFADRALYRAKAEGRDRVAPAPLALVEGAGGAIRLPVDIARAAAPAPLAG